MDGHLSYECDCDVGWTGDDCETGKDGGRGGGGGGGCVTEVNHQPEDMTLIREDKI